MIDDADLQAAVAAGVLDASTAARLRAFVAEQRRLPAADEESVRLVSSFNDIFVVLASTLLLLALAWLGRAAAPWAGGAAVAAAAWALAEPFVRQRRMALPALVLTLAFIGGVAAAVADLLGDGALATSLGLAAAVPAAALHWRRFRVPCSVAAGLAAGLGALLTVWMALVPPDRQVLPLLLMLAGLLSFAVAMRHDLADRERLTRHADVAFWLHLLAAPLMVHPVFSALATAEAPARQGLALAALGLYLALALLSLAIDRRALLVSALGYVLYALRDLLVVRSGHEAPWAAPALLLGLALLGLSAWWPHARQRVVGRLPARWQQRLPPLR